MSSKNKQNTKSKTPEDPDAARYNVPIKGYVGRVKRTIFYVLVTGDGTILEYSCQNIHDMVVVTQEDVYFQIKRFLSRKK